jgi:hypothetical protein
MTKPPAAPFREAFGGWILGSPRFIDELRTREGLVVSNPPAPEAVQLAGLDPDRICAEVARFYGLDRACLSRRYDPHLARAVAAWLCRRYTQAPHRELAERLGLSRADSVPNLTRRLEARLRTSRWLAEELEQIMTQVRAQIVLARTPDPSPRGVEAEDGREKRSRTTENKV